MKKNLFIAFEGIDGSGKSTQVKLLADRLTEQGYKIYTTFEPTDSRIGAIIHDIFKHKAEADHRTIAGLFVADRLDHILNKTNGILKKLEEGYTVITDRYYFSSYAYQGSHMDMNWVISANSLCAEILKPDCNIYIDISPEKSMERLNKVRSTIELYETLENLKNVKYNFYKAFELLKGQENIFIIDGNRSTEIVAVEIWNEILRYI